MCVMSIESYYTVYIKRSSAMLSLATVYSVYIYINGGNYTLH